MSNAFTIFFTIGVISFALLTTTPSNATNFAWIYIFISNCFIGVLRQYVYYVNDFDEPKEKKKVVKESLTELMAKAWQDLVGGLAPAPNYGV